MSQFQFATREVSLDQAQRTVSSKTGQKSGTIEICVAVKAVTATLRSKLRAKVNGQFGIDTMDEV